jgi:hypothetical protein
MTIVSLGSNWLVGHWDSLQHHQGGTVSLFIHETGAFTFGKKASIAIAIMLGMLGPYMNLPILFYVALTLHVYARRPTA